MQFLSELPELVAFLGSSAVATAMLAPLIMSGTVSTSSPETEAPEQQKQPKIKTVSTAAPTETVASVIDGPANEQPLQPVNPQEAVKAPKTRIRAKNLSPQLKAIEQKMVVVEKLMKRVVNLQNLQIAVEKDLANRKRDLYERTFTEYLLELKDTSLSEESSINKKLVQDYAAELFLKGTHQKIKFDYQRNQEKINANVECCDNNNTPTPPAQQQPQTQQQTQTQTQTQSRTTSQIQGITSGTDAGMLTPKTPASIPGGISPPPAIPGRNITPPARPPVKAPVPATQITSSTPKAQQYPDFYNAKDNTVNITKLLGIEQLQENNSITNSVKNFLYDVQTQAKTAVIGGGKLLTEIGNSTLTLGAGAAGLLFGLLQFLNPFGGAAMAAPVPKASGGIVDTELHNSDSTNYFRNLSRMVPYASGGAADFWTLAAVTAAEDAINPQGRADVAQSVYNRVRSGMYDGGTSIKKNILSPGQYSVTFPNPKDWKNITDKKSANLALRRSGKPHVSAEVAAKNITNPLLMKNAKKFVGGRPDFLGEQFKPNMNPKLGDITRGKTHNFFGWMNNYKGKVPGEAPTFKNVKYASGGIVNSNRSSKLETAQESFIQTSSSSNKTPEVIPLDPRYIQLPKPQRTKEISPLKLSPPGVNIPNADVPLINRRTTGARFSVR